MIKIFKTVVQPILTYGAEIWGSNYDASKIDRLGVKLAKEILGVSQSSATEAVLQDLNWERASLVVKKLQLGYAFRVKHYEGINKTLQKAYIEGLKEKEVGTGWLGNIADMLKKYRLEESWFYPLEVSLKSLKEIIFQALRNEAGKKREGEISKMTSLAFYRKVRKLGSPENYIEINRKARSGIAWLRVGGWMWQSVKVEGVRTCPLCGRVDGVDHIW